MDVQAKRADEARKQIANLKAMDAAYVARYSARAKSVPSDLWKEVEVKLGLFLDNASQYYRSVRDNYPKGIAVWGAGYEKYRPMAMPVLNRLNAYFGGTTYSNDHIQKNFNNELALIPLLEGYRNYIRDWRALNSNPFRTSLWNMFDSPAVDPLVWDAAANEYYDPIQLRQSLVQQLAPELLNQASALTGGRAPVMTKAV